jgi:hypothetical protein
MYKIAAINVDLFYELTENVWIFFQHLALWEITTVSFWLFLDMLD